MLEAAPIACNLRGIPDAHRPRYFALRERVLSTIQDATETEDGFAMRVGADLVALADWISFERLCCPFLSFRIEVDGDGPVRLELGGAEGVKDFLRGELEALGRSALVSPASLVR